MDSITQKKNRYEFFCPLCCSRQRTNIIPKVSWIHHAQILLATIAVTYLCWDFFGGRALGIYLVFWGGFEFVYRQRKRRELVCRNCGFDPFLYSRDVEKMRVEVKNFLQNRILNEGYFKGKKLKNYQSPPKTAANPSAAEEAVKGTQNPDKVVIPMPSENRTPTAPSAKP